MILPLVGAAVAVAVIAGMCVFCISLGRGLEEQTARIDELEQLVGGIDSDLTDLHNYTGSVRDALAQLVDVLDAEGAPAVPAVVPGPKTTPAAEAIDNGHRQLTAGKTGGRHRQPAGANDQKRGPQ